VSVNLDERRARVLFNLADNMTPVRFRKILERFGSALAAYEADAEEWDGLEDVSSAQARKLHRHCREAASRLPDELALLEKHRARALIETDEEFPVGVRALSDAPIVLYVKGDYRPADSLAVAMVGTRQSTPYGRAACEKLARELAQAGVTVVSGLARGIDAVAHATVLKFDGRTIGVLGSGLARFYPPENKPLATRMVERGAVMSEFPLATPPDRGNFPRRNRLISGLALAVVVVEADETSGSLITARLAGEQGKDVFAVPGSIFSKYSRGPHRLLKQGAHAVEGVEDILEAIEVFKNLSRPVKRPAPVQTNLTAAETALMECIRLDPVGMDELSVKAHLPASALSSALLGLELKGMIKALPGPAYVRSEHSLSSPPV